MDVVGLLPKEFLEVPYNGAMIPGRQPDLGLTLGANCQRFAYAVLEHFDLLVDPFRSSDLWEDTTMTTIVAEPQPLDLVLVASGRDACGAHVGVCVGGEEVLHLCAEVGVPTVWSLADFAERHRYRTLLGFKHVSRQRAGGVNMC